MPLEVEDQPPIAADPADDVLDEGEEAVRLPPKRPGAVRHAGGMGDRTGQHADDMGQQVAPVANDIPARLPAGCVERRAALAVWLSVIAIVWLAMRHACSRTATEDA